MHIRRPLCLYSAVFALLLCLITYIFPPRISELAEKNADRGITLTGTITKKEIKNDKLRLYIGKIDGLSGVMADLDPEKYIFEDLKIGSRIKISGVFTIYEQPVNEGQFDYRKYYLIRNIQGKLNNAKVIAVSEKCSKPREYLARLRQKAERVFRTYMSERDAGIMEALVLGDKNDLDGEIKDLYQAAGISHVLSLSGLHIAAVGLFVMGLFKKTGFPRWLCSAISMVLMVSYAMMTGMSVSTQRALFMFSLAILAELIGRTYDLLSAAALSSVFILIGNPYMIMDTGFLLSFLAVIAIGVVYPAFAIAVNPGGGLKMCEEIRTGIKGQIFEKISHAIDTILVSMSIFFTTLPVVAMSFYKVSRYSFIANLIIIPLMGTLLATGFSGVAVGMVQYLKMASKYHELRICSGLLTPLILKISSVILRVYEWISESICKMYGSTMVTGKPEVWQILIYYLILCLVVYLCYGMEKGPSTIKMIDHVSRRKFGNNAKYLREILNKITPRKILIILLLMISVVTVTYRNRSCMEIRNLSVGQGDCAVIYGKRTPVIVVDGGSTDVKNVGKYRIIPALLSNGIDEVDYMFISHLDADHYNGLMEILKNNTCGIRVKRVIISSLAGLGDVEEKKKLTELEQVASDAGAKLYRMGQGDVISAGNLKITCIYPIKTPVIEKTDGNDTSLVLRIDCEKAGFSAMFTGDISSNAEGMINHEHLDCDYLKVAHHGSRGSSAAEFINNVSPVISVISAGKDNSYGHPHKETLERLEKFVPGNKVFRTDESGQITISVIEDRSIRVKQFRERSKDDK